MSETAQLIFKFKTDAAVVVLVVALVVVVVAVDDVVALLVSVPLKQVHAFDGSLGVSCSKVVMFGVQDTRGGNLRGRFKRVIIILPTRG